MRLIRLACALGSLTVTAPVFAHDVPVCGSPEVLEAVVRLLVQTGSAAQVEAASVGQVPTARLDTVLCGVRLLNRFYDTNRFGLLPLVQAEVFEYTVRRVRGSLLVVPVGTRRG